MNKFPLRLAYISPSIIPSRFANSVHVMKMCSAFAHTGADVELFCKRGDDAEDCFAVYGVENTFKISFVSWNTLLARTPLGGYLMAYLARRSGVNIVFGRYLPACYFAARMGIPVIYESHNPVESRSKNQQRMLRRLVKSEQLKGIVVISTPLKSDFVSILGLSDDRILVAHDAADDSGSIQTVSLGDKNRLQVGYVGQLYEGRGIEIIADLAKHCSWADFHVFGGMDDAIGQWKAKTKDACNLTFHGFIPPAQTPAIMRGCDVLLAPYQSKVSVNNQGDTSAWMSPMKLFEYMAAERAIVCSDIPVLHEILHHEGNALFCSPLEVDEWTQALLRLNDDPELRSKLGRRARRDFLDAHTWRARAKKILDYFNL